MDSTTLASYQKGLQHREALAHEAQAQRREQAWEVARHVAAWLREHYGVTQVMVFGSLAHGQWFSVNSDIDLAVWDIATEDYFEAIARVQDLSEFRIDLVAMETCKPSLCDVILQEGIKL